MKGRIVFLLEEPSMKVLLDGLLPRLFPGWLELEHFQCVPHEGKSHLDRSISVKLKAWREPHVRFVIVRDNDSADCQQIKSRITDMCGEAGRPETLIRLVCQELESWYVGDLRALAEAFDNGKLNSPALRKRFSDPDRWQKPSVEVRRLVPTFQKLAGARMMAPRLMPLVNRSKSFQSFVSGVSRIASEMGYEADASGGTIA